MPELGYFILCRVWNRLLPESGIVSGHHEAMDVVSALKQAIIYGGNNLDVINALQDANNWLLFHELSSRARAAIAEGVQ